MAQTINILNEFLLIQDISNIVLSFFSNKTERDKVVTGLGEYCVQVRNPLNGLNIAVETCQFKLAEYFINICNNADLDEHLFAACLTKRLDVVKFLLGNIDLDRSVGVLFRSSCRLNEVDAIKCLAPYVSKQQLNEGLEFACSYEHCEAIEELIEAGASNAESLMMKVFAQGRIQAFYILARHCTPDPVEMFDIIHKNRPTGQTLALYNVLHKK